MAAGMRPDRLELTHVPGCRDGVGRCCLSTAPTYVNVGDLLPVVAVQPVPQQGLLWELPGGRNRSPGSRLAFLASPQVTPSPRDPAHRMSWTSFSASLLCFSRTCLSASLVTLLRFWCKYSSLRGRAEAPGLLASGPCPGGGGQCLWGQLSLPVHQGMCTAPRDEARWQGAHTGACPLQAEGCPSSRPEEAAGDTPLWAVTMVTSVTSVTGLLTQMITTTSSAAQPPALGPACRDVLQGQPGDKACRNPFRRPAERTRH